MVKEINNNEQIKKSSSQFKQSIKFEQIQLSHNNVNDYYKMIIDFILSQDKFRCKLLNLSIVKHAITFEQAFPKRYITERFEYIGSGSYAQVYRHELITPLSKHYHHQILNWNNSRILPQKLQVQNIPPVTIIKLIEVFAEDLLKNLVGVSLTSSVSNYKDVYNEFRISIALSYLNEGIRYKNLAYQCPLFPSVYGCYIINKSVFPDYFEDSKHLCKLNLKKLLENEDTEKEDTDHDSDYLSRPSLREIQMIEPEIAAIKMEDCGQSLYDQMCQYRPLEILSVTKQLLMGFVIAEDAFQFEHRDLHLGNILVKKTPNEQLLFVYQDRFLQMPSHQLLVKVIDTTFSRLKIKKRIHYRDLSHLFDEKDLEFEAGPKNHLGHQKETYQAMASEIKHDWSGFYPRTNHIWLIYVIKKFGRILRKQPVSHESNQVHSILKLYVSSLFKVKDMKTFYERTLMKSQLNLLVPIQILSENNNNVIVTNIQSQSKSSSKT